MNKREFEICIQENYPQFIIHEIRDYSSQTINKIFSAGEEKLIIKLFSSDKNVKNSVEIQHMISKYGLSPYIYTNYNNQFLSYYNKQTYIVQQLLGNGEVKREFDYDALINAMVKLHNILKQNREKYQFIDKRIAKSSSQIMDTISNDEILISSLRDKQFYYTLYELIQLRKRINRNYKISYCPTEIEVIHGDIRPSNILSAFNKYYFIDFDFVCIGDLLFEIGSAAMLFSNYNSKLAQLFIKKYLIQAGLDRKILYEHVITDLAAYYVQSSFPISLINFVKEEAIKKMSRERIYALKFCERELNKICQKY